MYKKILKSLCNLGGCIFTILALEESKIIIVMILLGMAYWFFFLGLKNEDKIKKEENYEVD